MISTPKADLKSLANELKQDIPDDLHTMLDEKESKEEAKSKYEARKKMRTTICAPTCTGITSVIEI